MLVRVKAGRTLDAAFNNLPKLLLPRSQDDEEAMRLVTQDVDLMRDKLVAYQGQEMNVDDLAAAIDALRRSFVSPHTKKVNGATLAAFLSTYIGRGSG